jgi:hypothetical protein
MSAIEKTFQTCLPPEAYLRIIRRINDTTPRIRSTVYPQKKTTNKKEINK